MAAAWRNGLSERVCLLFNLHLPNKSPQQDGKLEFPAYIIQISNVNLQTVQRLALIVSLFGAFQNCEKSVD